MNIEYLEFEIKQERKLIKDIEDIIKTEKDREFRTSRIAQNAVSIESYEKLIQDSKKYIAECQMGIKDLENL